MPWVTKLLFTSTGDLFLSGATILRYCMSGILSTAPADPIGSSKLGWREGVVIKNFEISFVSFNVVKMYYTGLCSH